jgi:hypothetical protein
MQALASPRMAALSFEAGSELARDDGFVQDGAF